MTEPTVPPEQTIKEMMEAADNETDPFMQALLRETAAGFAVAVTWKDTDSRKKKV